MKLRLFPLLASVIVSAIVLFGGYFAYRSVAMESPLQNVVESMDGVELVSVNLGGPQAIVELKLAPEVGVREVYEHIQTEGASSLGNKTLNLKVVEDNDRELEKWWASALFDVAQAMETRHYSEIPQALEARASELGDGMNVHTEMDETNVYITLLKGDATKRIILPRQPAMMGVWSNE